MNAPDAPFRIAQANLLSAHDLDSAKIAKVFGAMRVNKLDFADLFFQYSRSEGWSLEEGIVKSGSFNIEQGVGVRAISGEKTAFAYSDDIGMPALLDAAEATRAMAHAGRGARVAVKNKRKPTQNGAAQLLYQGVDPLASLADSEKVSLLERLERKCRAKDPRITQVMASLAGVYELVLIARSDGVMAADVRPLVRMSVQVIAES
ncbi:MAG: PmbA/TldA family metallopeptidase, partial [Burkholderiales bacterium]